MSKASEKTGIKEKFLRAVREHHMLRTGETVLAAVSGGADSAALLLLLYEIRTREGFNLAAAHFEHGIRGQESQEDMRFVRELCKALDVVCYCECGDVPALAEKRKRGIEEAARSARYDFLNRTADRIGADRIALGHHREDQAETILLHLIHGCGVDGICGMPFVRERFIRPMLDISREEIEGFLKDRGITWRNDLTNDDNVHVRNRLRNQVLPQLRLINPRVDEALCRTAALAQHAAGLINAEALQMLQDRIHRFPGGVFWRETPGRMRAEALRLLCRQSGVPEMTMEQVERLEMLGAGEKAELPGQWTAQQTEKALYLIRTGGRARLNGCIVRVPAGDDLGNMRTEQEFDRERIIGSVLRFPEPGDRFRPMGSNGRQKLTEALRNAGIDLPMRDRVPVLAKGKSILWIVGTGKIADEAAVRQETCERVRLCYKGPVYWLGY